MSRYLPWVLMVPLFSCCIEVEIAVPSFPVMAHYFHVDSQAIQLLLSMNLLGFCLAASLYGPLADYYGRKPVMLIGNALLVLGSLLAVVSPNLSLLYIARFIQGIGAASSAVLVFTVIADVYEEEKSFRLISRFNAVFSASMAMAPLLGCFILSTVGWRGAYGFILLLSSLSLVLLYKNLPETSAIQRDFKFNHILKQYGQFFLNLRFLLAAIVPSLLYAGYMAFISYAPFLYREHYGLSLGQYAIWQMIIIASFSVSSWFSDKALKAMGQLKLLLLSMSLLALSQLFFHFVLKTSIVTSFSMMLYCIAFAFIYPIIFNDSMAQFPKAKGMSASFIMSLRTLIMAVIISVTSLNFLLFFSLNVLCVFLMLVFLLKKG